MVHLSEILDNYSHGNIQVASVMDDETGMKFKNVVLRRGPTAICFDIGNTEGMVGLKEIHSLIRLPYETCWFEGRLIDNQKKTTLFGFLSFEEIDDGVRKLVSIHFSRKLPDHEEWIMRCSSFWYIKPNGMGQLDIGGHSDEKLAEWDTELHSILRTFLSVLNCSNVKQQQHLPPRAMRRHPGKGHPLFSWWTLHLKLPNERTPSLPGGGHHASPRVHLRRGHIRRYQTGHYCWIQDMVVGKKELGIVHKDYRANFSNVLVPRGSRKTKVN
jgi:hypothetical protein